MSNITALKLKHMTLTKEEREIEKQRLRDEQIQARVDMEEFKLRLANEKAAKQLGLK